MPRYVILRHDVDAAGARRLAESGRLTNDSHCDWMFEDEDCLRTWASPLITSFDQEFVLAVDQLADHRLAYLDFEGPISAGRGQVRRLLKGTYERWELSAEYFRATLTDACRPTWRGQLEIQRSCSSELPTGITPAVWRLRFSPW